MTTLAHEGAGHAPGFTGSGPAYRVLTHQPGETDFPVGGTIKRIT